ncbi:MAG: hypothetical protein DRP30_05860 [Thermotoga sp.]|nr:MAG: hypothetical protein DRP30_05860 [Thermotoga sp.]
MGLIAKVYGVSFLPVGRIIYYSENLNESNSIDVGDLVLAMTDFGIEVGKIVVGLRDMEIDEIGYEIKPIIRKLNEKDMKIYKRNLRDARDAFWECRSLVKKHGLEMKILHARYTFDRSRLIFLFGAEGRVDFRELVKDLAKEFKTRIELWQVGVRDELKFMGGVGLCGRPVCCSEFLREFESVTLKDAKKQQLLINPVKISGQCRRLLCCLRFEKEIYDEIMEGIPEQDDVFEYEGTMYRVTNVNIFTGLVTALSDDGRLLKIPFEYFRKAKIIE